LLHANQEAWSLQHQATEVDVAVTGVDGQSRASDEATERPLQTRYDQKNG